jgi:hypothetical protein
MSTRELLIVVAGSLLAAVIVGCQVDPPNNVNGPVAGPSPAPSPTAPPINSATESVLICIDKSQSEDDGTLKDLAPELKEALAAWPTLREVVVLNVGADGKGPWNAHPQKFNVPETSSGNIFDLAAAEQHAKDICGGRERCEEREVKEAKQRFDDQLVGSARDIESQRAAALDHIAAAVTEAPTKEPPFSDVNGMAGRIAEMPSLHVIWITDGQHNVPNEPLKPLVFPNNKKVLLAVIPLVNEGDSGFTQRRLLLSQMYSNASVVPSAALDASHILSFLNAP